MREALASGDQQHLLSATRKLAPLKKAQKGRNKSAVSVCHVLIRFVELYKGYIVLISWSSRAKTNVAEKDKNQNKVNMTTCD